MKEFLNKTTARQVLIRNFGNLDKAKDKLNDMFLMHSFNTQGMPLTRRVINYLDNLGYGVTTLYNICTECGTSYCFSNLATNTLCQLCANKARFKSDMISEPETYEELLHNLKVLRDNFDTPDDTSYQDLIEAVEIDRDIFRSYKQNVG